jgi:hypothetical protein
LAKHGFPASVCYPLVAKRIHPANAALNVTAVVRAAQLLQQLHDIQCGEPFFCCRSSPAASAGCYFEPALLVFMFLVARPGDAVRILDNRLVWFYPLFAVGYAFSRTMYFA